jgi:hypothetical protein
MIARLSPFRLGPCESLCLGLVGLLGLIACAEERRRGPGEFCAKDSACKPPLRCSLSQKQCYRPVDCALLAERLKTCLPEMVTLLMPESRHVAPPLRVKRMERMAEQLESEVVGYCRHDGLRGHGQKRKQLATLPKHRYGEDPQAAEVSACLRKADCLPFARCILDLARMTGPNRPDPTAPRPLPLGAAWPNPAPDGGSPTTDATTPATDSASPLAPSR